MSPENELDHTLEYVRTALMSIFSARRIRVYGVDEANDRLFIKVRFVIVHVDNNYISVHRLTIYFLSVTVFR